MTNIQKSVPVLRFKDELGNCYPPWGEKKFSFIAKKVNDSYKPTNNGESFECIELESLSSETGLLIRTFRSSEQKSMKTKFLTGDVLFGKLRPYLKKFYRSDFDGVCTSEIWVLRPKSVPSEFLFYVVQSGHFNRLANIQSGTKMPRSNWGIVSQSIFKIPSDYGEQQKIASFLSSVDTKIEQLSEQKTLLEQYKKGMMQKLFNQEIRFKDEQGKDYPDWEEVRAAQIFTSHTNKKHNSDLPILAATQDRGVIPRNETGLEIQSSARSIASYKVIEPGDFVISLRSFQGGIEYSEYHGIGSPAYTVLKPIVEIISDFFRFYFKKKNFISRLCNTIIGIRDGKQIPYGDFAAMKLCVPSLKEQQKIAAFLSSIDKKIELVTEQLKQARTFKKGLLQQMFI